jgi:tetraacyldisaccharide 4'-kinase
MIMGDGDPDLADFRGPRLRAHLVAKDNDFRGKTVFAFAGIGRPEKFVASLKETGAIVTGSHFFADHHAFTAEEISRLRKRAGGARLVTTEKDLARLGKKTRTGIFALPVQVRFDDEAALDAVLARLLDRSSDAG